MDKNTVTTAPLQSSVIWKKKGGKRYCYRNGRKLTGFQQIDGAWYYFNSKGIMCIGWQHIRNHYRYFSKKTGKMRVNTTIQGRKINSKGIWTPVVVLDPGHTGVVAGGYEPLGPGSSEMKAKDTSGTEGIATGVSEYQLTLKVAKQLSTALKKQGCKVVMTRTNSKNSLSCIQRAKVANKAKADAYLRIHANGSSNSSTNGAMTICVTKNNRFVSSKLYEKSYALSQSVRKSNWLPQRIHLADRHYDRQQLEQSPHHSHRNGLYVQSNRRPENADQSLPEKDGKRNGRRNKSLFPRLTMIKHALNQEPSIEM